MTIPVETQNVKHRKSTSKVRISSGKTYRTKASLEINWKSLSLEWLVFISSVLVFLLIAASGIPRNFLPKGSSPHIPVGTARNFSSDYSSIGIKKAAIDIQSFLDTEKSPQGSFVFSAIKIREGDRLSLIAGEKGISLATLMQVNHLDTPKKMKPGMTFMIPSKEGILYKVGKNDTLESIVEDFGLTGELKRDFLHHYSTLPTLGSEVFIPGGQVKAAKARSWTEDVFLYPVAGTVITRFGEVVDSVTGMTSLYEGIDIASDKGTAVHAAKEGTVLFARQHPSLGYCIVIAHSDNMVTLYGQLLDIMVSEGNKVEQGEAIGHLGSPVFGKIDHVYFSMKKGERVIDPLPYLY